MVVKSGYKKTDIGVIPIDWEIKQLSTISSMKSGVGITSSKISEYSLYPCYGGNGLRGFTNRYTHEGAFALIGRQGALCGNVVGVSGKFFASEHAIVVTPRQDVNIEFLTYVLGAMNLNRLSEASAQPGLSVTKILKLSVVTPCTKSEQRAIAKALSDVDALLAALDQLIGKKRDLKQAAMQQLLTGKIRLPGFSGDWERLTLGSLCGRITTGKLDANAMTDEGDYVFFTCARESYRIDRYAFDCEALLVSGNGANVGYVHYYNGKFNAYQRTYVLSDFAADVYFLKIFLDKNLHERIRTEVNAGNTPYITMGTLTEMEVCLPNNREEQQAIAKVLSDMDTELDALEQRRDKTKALKQAMMQELLTGKTRLITPEQANA